MPSLTITGEENSPLITFGSGWTIGTSQTDKFASSYSGSSYMATHTIGASASFVFNGTGVQIFGAKRVDHGPYAVKVDDTLYPTGNGTAPDLYQENLFTVNGLDRGPHTVTITNQGDSWVDVDFITWSTDLGNAADKLFVTIVKDTDPSFSFSSALAWITNPKNVGSFLGGSGRATANPGASVVYTFQVQFVFSVCVINSPTLYQGRGRLVIRSCWPQWRTIHGPA